MRLKIKILKTFFLKKNCKKKPFYNTKKKKNEAAHITKLQRKPLTMSWHFIIFH